MVEIATLAHHYYAECAAHSQFIQCSKCKEPIHQDDYEEHRKDNNCKRMPNRLRISSYHIHIKIHYSDIIDIYQLEFFLAAKDMKRTARCLLCHQDVSPPSDKEWKRHLIGQDGCPANQRRVTRGEQEGRIIDLLD